MLFVWYLETVNVAFESKYNVMHRALCIAVQWFKWNLLKRVVLFDICI